MGTRLTRIGLRIWVAAVLAFLFIPIAIIILYAFNRSNVQGWPISGLSTKWFAVAWDDPQVRAALWLSVKAGLLATIIALVLGSAAAFGVHRFRFFGREAVSLLLVLPLALPGIITGIALNSAFHFAGIGLALVTIVIGHATFCIVVVYNNVIARLRRTSGSLYEAAADLGGHGLFVFRTITVPMLSTALVSGGLLAFALSFDEVIVTTFTAGAQNTLPLWIFGAIRLGQNLPEVNVVVAGVLVLTVIPVVIAARLTGDSGLTRTLPADRIELNGQYSRQPGAAHRRQSGHVHLRLAADHAGRRNRHLRHSCRLPGRPRRQRGLSVGRRRCAPGRLAPGHSANG